MRILLASSEVHPFSKSGGLADMVAALAKALGRAGHQVGLVTPLYAGILDRFPEIQPFDWSIDLPLGAGRVQASVWTLQPSPGPYAYFVDHAPFYSRASLYGEAGHDYPDNAQRFIFFSKCVVQLARYLPWRPEIVHAHDWQVGLVPILMLHQRLTTAGSTCHEPASRSIIWLTREISLAPRTISRICPWITSIQTDWSFTVT
jgi:starch synthase